MLNTIFIIIMLVGVPYMAVTLGQMFLGNLGAFIMMLVSAVVIFMIFKPQIYFILGQRKYSQNHEAAFKLLKKAHNTGRLKPQSSLIYAYLLLRDGQITESEKLISGVLYKSKRKLTKNNILAAELNLSLIAWKKGDLKTAIEKMEDVYDEGYRSSVHYGTLGVFYLMAGELEKADEFCHEAYEFNSDDMSIIDNLGLLYYKQNKLEDAKETYEKLFDEFSPEFIEAYYNYGCVLEKLGDIEGAKEYYTRALSCPERYLSTVKLDTVDRALMMIE